MAKKRRVTDDQARMLAIYVIMRAIDKEADGYISPLSDQELGTSYFRDLLPKKWLDGQTSEQSWAAIRLEMDVQLAKITECLDEEAKSIVGQNPEFRYTV